MNINKEEAFKKKCLSFSKWKYCLCAIPITTQDTASLLCLVTQKDVFQAWICLASGTVWQALTERCGVYDGGKQNRSLKFQEQQRSTEEGVQISGKWEAEEEGEILPRKQFSQRPPSSRLRPNTIAENESYLKALGGITLGWSKVNTFLKGNKVFILTGNIQSAIF